MTTRPAAPSDAREVADIWYWGWQEAHLGHVPEELVAARTEESFHVRAAQRVEDTTVAVIDDEVVGFVMVVGDEVEQVMSTPSTNVRGSRAAGNARARRFYERQGWRDEGPFDYRARTEQGAVAVPCHRYVLDTG